MGVGATWAGGCIISNGLVGTARLSIMSWLALIFMSLGIWFSTQLLLMKNKT